MPPPRDWNDPSTAIYPDPAFEIFDPRFGKYSGGTAGVVRVWTGGVWTEGPVWFGDQQRLIFSDIPNDRLMAYDVTYWPHASVPPAVQLHQRQHPRPPGPPGLLRAGHAPRHPHRV